MNIVRKDIDSVNATITIGIEKADYSEKVDKKLREYRKKANVPGFRPGMVPIGLLKKMYGKSILAEEINKMLSEELYNYIRDNEINILGEPLPNVAEQKLIDFSTEENFDFVFDLGLSPDFEVELNKKDKIKFYEITPSAEMIDNQVKSYTSRYGRYVQEEIVEEKDMVKGELVELAGADVKEHGIVVNDAVLTPAYIKDETIKSLFINAKVGEVITFNPKTAFENETEISSLLKIKKEEVAGIDSDFQLTISGITRYYEAELNQELFDKVFGEEVVSSEVEFRAKISENIQISLNNDSNYKFGIDARDALVAKYENLVFPEAFLKRWLKASNEKMTEENIEKDFPKMINDLKWQLIKDKIGKANEIKVENEEVNVFARQIARSQFAQYGIPVEINDPILDKYTTDMLKKEDTLRNIIDKVYENKVLEIIKSSVKLETKAISIEDFNKMVG